MKRLFLTISMLILLFSSCTINKSKGSLELQVQISKKMSKSKSNKLMFNVGSYYSAKIDLINNTDSNIRFWGMKCFWTYIWVFNIDSIWMFNKSCDANFPIINQINSKERLSYDGIINMFCDSNTYKNKEIKIGFVFINENEIHNDLEFRKLCLYKIKKKIDIIWSNSFIINK